MVDMALGRVTRRVLLQLAIVMAVFFFITRYAHWATFMRGLSVVGFLVPVVWAPLVQQYWRQRQAQLHHDWGLAHVPPDEHVNPKALYRLRIADAVKKETERVYDPYNNRRRVRLLLIPFIALNVALMCATVLPFVQWYAYGRMAPLCSCCTWHQAQGAVGVGNSTAFGMPAECSYLLPQVRNVALLRLLLRHA